MPRIGAGGARVIAAGLTAIQTHETKNGLGEFLKLGSIDFFSSSIGHLEQRRYNPVITLGKRPRESPEELRDGGRQAARAQAAQALDKLRVCLAESEKSSQKSCRKSSDATHQPVHLGQFYTGEVRLAPHVRGEGHCAELCHF